MSHFDWSAEWRDEKTWQLIAPPAPIVMDTFPQITIEEVKLMTSNGHSLTIPRKKSFNEVKITYSEIENSEGAALFMQWVSTQYRGMDCWDIHEDKFVSDRATVILRLHDKKGEVLEIWYLENSCITALDFGHLTHSKDCEVNVAVRYSDVSYSTPDPATWLKPVT